ncbi:MAG: hypothetical protein CUN48_13265 [Candidatus Thermofonsia Clade 3 bacterium]|uniref:Uncharacterized protein n=1 Tax=Candidatus Thermofonsia Clade 3 bacterium TaxID=2364212 RepID=A0A2M8Q9Q9_9CHLR|nr:MAG: hypothetical protein CUN48_13265 [Candidatus Thermofonsia Clade 3 bacterium]
MTNDLSFTLDIPADERESLLALLRAMGAEVQSTPSRDFDWQTVVVIIDEIGKVATGVTAIIVLAEKIAEKLNAWRATMRRQGKTPRGVLRRPHQPPLDLSTATDQEVLAWLLRTSPRP